QTIEMEAKLVIELATTKIYPAAISHLSNLASTAADLSKLNIKLEHTGAEAAASEANAMMEQVGALREALAQHDFDTIEAHLNHCAHTLCGLMLAVRTHADRLEGLVADELWPLPKYREMLFIK
ncbi:MAG TPA: glutamine synthetase type III, partial [Motiliproteus sp.]